MARKAAALALIALQAMAALAMFALSVHAPAGLGVAAPLYFAAAAALTWWTARKSGWLLIVAGVATLAAPPAIYGLLDLAERSARDRRIAATQVSDVSDEPILADGKPIGVRLAFSVVVPERGHFGITPWLYPRREGLRHLQLVPVKWRFDGRPAALDFGPFEAGRKHRLEFDLYPPLIAFAQNGTRCRAPSAAPQLPDSAPGPLLVDISETSYGALWRGGREEPTRATYDVAAMYRAVLAEGLPACRVGP